MIIALNLPIQRRFNCQIMAGLLPVLGGRPDVKLWAPYIKFNELTLPEHVDGIIGNENDAAEPFLNSGVPVINIRSEPAPGTTHICTDNSAIAKLAVDHFLSIGLRNFAYLHDETFPFSHIRWKVFSDACESLGFFAHLLPYRFHKRRSDQAHSRLKARLLSLPKPIGILIPSDRYGKGVMQACSEVGLDVPRDVAVLSVNNDPELCQQCSPELSSIDSSIEKIGELCLKTLIKAIEGKKVPSEIKVLPRGVIKRESTDRNAQTDPDVAQTLDFMIKHLEEPIVMEDFTRPLGMGRRALEKKFKASVGESPMAYLHGLRLARIGHLLATTELKVVEIGSRCGIPNVSYLCKTFKQRFNVTPLQYRQSAKSDF